MATTSSSQLENLLIAVLKSGDVRPLDEFLEMNAYKGVSINCSKQFLNKLDKLVSSSLDKKETRSACLGLESLHKCGKDLKLPGGQGVSGLISQGLIQKWFGKCRELWIQQGPHWDKTMYVLCENFLNVLMMVHESCKEGTSEVTDSFLYLVGQLAVDPRIYILIQKEAIRKYNIILDKMPLDFKKNRRLLTSQEASDIMNKLAGRILDSGDYDMQSSLMEALFRMVTPDQRKKLADRWFSMGHVATAFAQISDSEFETACRRFLNMVNGMQGDKRRVCSYPCLKVYLGKYELLMPSDEKLEEFWIDFNLGSRSISFYFSLPDEEDAHWETVCIDEHEVQSYTVTEVGKRQILQIKLSEVIVIDSVEGSILCIQFSSSLDILQAAQNVFGNDKNKIIHEVKAAVKATEADNIAQQSSQVVPESQVSLGETEKTTAPYDLPTATAQMVTPAKKRMSESTTYISSNERGSVKTSSFLPDKSSTKNNSKIPMVKLSVCGTTIMNCSTNTTPHSTNMVDKSGQKMPVAGAEDVTIFGQGVEKSQGISKAPFNGTPEVGETYFVPDTQPSSACNMKSNWSKLSMSEMLKMPTQKMGSVPEPNWGTFEPQKHCTSSGRMSVPASSLKLQQQFHNELTERLQKVLNDVSKDPPRQESTDQQRKTSDSKRGSDKTKSHNTRGSKSVPKIQNTQRTRLSKNAKREEMSLQVDIGPTKASDKTCTNKTVEDHKEFEAKGCKKTAISTKEKSDSNVTATMMKRISSHYEIETKTLRKISSDKSSPSWIPPLTDRPIFNKEVLPACRKDKLGTISLGKLLNSTRGSDRDDSFAFKVDSPISVRGENQTKSSSGYNNSTIHTSAKKGQPVAKKKLHVKKHLFSDTDTDNAPTDISWLRESFRKSKAQVITYTRHAKLKPKTAPPHSPDTPRDLQSISSKGVKGESKRIQKIINPPKKVNHVADLRPQVATKRPRRAAATATKSYQEPKTDESDSETEEPPSPKHSSICNMKNPEKVNGVATAKKKKTAHKQPTDMKLSEKQSVLDACPSSKVEICSAGQQRKRVENCAEDPPVKKSKHNLYDHPAEKHSRADGSSLTDSKKAHFKGREQTSTLKNSLAGCLTSFSTSPPSIEHMRTAERSDPTLGLTCSTVLTPRGSPLPIFLNPPCQDTSSQILLLPNIRSPVGHKGKCKPSSFCNAEKKQSSQKTQCVPSPCSLAGPSPAPIPPTGLSATEIVAEQKHLSSVPQSLLSPSTQPLLTSTLIESDKAPVLSPSQLQYPRDTLASGCHLGLSKVSSVSLSPLSHLSPTSSVLSGKKKDISTMTTSYKEKTPLMHKNLKHTKHLVSGPALKRCVSLSSKSEEDENEEERKKSKIRGQHSPRMKPRKLFKSFEEVSVEDELSHMSSSHWETEEVYGDLEMDGDSELPEETLKPKKLCQQFTSELKNKLQNRSHLMEIYNKRSSKAVQHHILSIGVQFNENRIQRLSEVQNTLVEEIQKIERDVNLLKNMEKDLAIYWEKQITTFHSYQDCETKRNDTLKRTFQSIYDHGLDYEEGVFKSEMDLIKKDLKSIQDRLLDEMHEQEIQSMKRGIHALFFSG